MQWLFCWDLTSYTDRIYIADMELSWADFENVEMRVGTITSASLFVNAKRPAYVLHIDFGELGIKKSSAQITDLYQPQDLIGKQVIAVVNFPPKQIADMISECLVLGVVGMKEGVVLLSAERPVPNGLRIS